MNPYRKQKLASAIQEILGESLQRDIHDPRISPLTTITRVELTGDLALARVYVSVIGTPTEEKLTEAGLRHATTHLQRQLASELTIRQCPQLEFALDEGARKARSTILLIEQNRREREAKEQGSVVEGSVADDAVDDLNELDDLPNEDDEDTHS